MLNKKLLKTLLTTASAMAVMSGAATSASAADKTTNNAAATITEDGANTTGFVGGAVAWSNLDNVIFGAFDTILTTGAAGDVTMVDVTGSAANDATIAAAANTTTVQGSVLLNGGTAVNATIANNATLVFEGADLSGLGTINGVAAGNGTVSFTGVVANGGVGIIGGNFAVGTFNTSGVASTFANAIIAKTMNVTGNDTTFAGDLTAATALNFTDVTGVTAGVVANGTGAVNVSNSTVTTTGAVTANSLTLTGSSKFTVGAALHVNVATTFSDDSTLALSNAATFTGGVTAATPGTGTIAITIGANRNIAGKIGTTASQLGVVSVSGAGAATFTGGVYAKTLALGNATGGVAGAAVLNAITNNVSAITNISGVDNQGVLTFGSVVDQSNNIVGTIGAEGAALGTVTVNGVGNNVFGSAIYAQTLATGANAGTNATFNGAVNVNTLTIGAGASTVTANGAVNVKAAAGIGAGATLVVGTADGKSAAPYLQAIDGDGTVTFNSQVNALVTNTSGIGAIGANAGPALVNVNFAGDNTFSETVDATTMTLGKGANVTAKSDVTVGTLNVNTGTFTTESTSVLNAIVNFADNGKLVANKAVAGGHAITTATNNTGTVEFNDVQGAGTVGAIGAVNKALKAVSINGAGASEFDEITAQTINVGANVTTAALNGAIAAEALNIGGTAAVTADVALSVVKTGTTGAVNFTGDASLITTAAQTVAIDAITTNANETGTVTFAQGVVARNDAVNAAAHAAVGNIGAKGAALKVLNLGNGGTLAGAVFAKDINLTGADLTVTGSVTGNLATTTARTITLTGGNFTGDIKNNGGDATLVLGDKAIFTGNVGLSNALAAEVSVAADAKASMAGNVNAAAFTLNNKAELTLNGASKINTEVPGNVGAGVTVNTVAANAATINMNSNNLEVTGFVMPVNGVLNVNYGATPGKLSMTNALVGATGFNAKSTVTLSLGAKPELATAGTEYTLLDVTTTNAANFKAVGTLLDAKTKKVTLADASNDYVTLSGLTITAKANDAGYWGKATTGRQTAAAIKASGADKIATGRATTDGIFTTFATAYGNGTTGGTEDAYFAKLGRLSAAERAADFAKVSNVAPVVSAATSAVVSATEAAASAISSRVATVASGDDNRQMGAWVSGFGSMGKQGARKGDAGYKAKTAGITLGADTELSDSAVLGLAANFTNADLKLKNQLAGGKVKAKTYMVSLYGLYNISDFVISGAASVGSSKSTVNTAGTSKFSSTNFGAKATVGYKYNMSDVMLTPMAGLEFARFGKSNATETGTQRVIKIKALNKVAAILGAKVATEMSGVTPEVHAFLNYDLTNNAQKATVGLGSDATVNIATPNAKAARMSYNLGTSVSAVADDIEYGIGYDATISNKYVAHQGSIKVRLNF